MRNIYIFNMTSRSIRYGIGTYIRQLIRSARYAGLKVHYVLISDEIIIPNSVIKYYESQRS